jgi:hypothetical protein
MDVINALETAEIDRTSTQRPSLSVVVIGRNEGQRLARCLQSISRISNVVVDEVIYVDSASTDNSSELAASYGATVIVVNPERPTAAIGRNAGWRRAKSALILFIDGDTILQSNFPQAACKALLDKSWIAAVWGHRRELAPQASLYNCVLDLDWVYMPGPTEFCGGDVLMRRSILLETNGFDEGLIAGEEPELCRRMRALGYSILHIDHAMTGHDLQMTHWSQYWRRAIRAGHAYAEVSERFRNSHDPFWGKDRRRNIIRGSFWIVTFASSAITAVWLGFAPLALWAVLLVLQTLRSAWKARWKGGKCWVLLLYGLHSHVQQVPILLGQIQYELDKRRGKARRLIEYKRAESEKLTKA